MIPINRQTIPTVHCSLARSGQRYFSVATAIACVFLSSCSDERWTVPESSLQAESTKPVLDLRKIIDALPQSEKEAQANWTNAVGAFGAFYSEDILRIGAANDPATIQKIKEFSVHPDVAPIESAIDSTSGSPENLARNEEQLAQALHRFRYFLPSEPTPRITWMNSGFNFAIYPTSSHLGIGLEWFLGPENPLVQTLPPQMFPQYMREKMKPERIPATAMRGWLLVHFSERFYDSSKCINELLYWGKIMFLLEKCLPEESRSNLLDWSAEDLQWAEANEQSIWLELQPQDMLFNSNRMEFGRWFDEGPFTRIGGIPQEGPDRLGAWLGLRMVNDFMKKNPEWSMDDLINLRDPLPIIKSYRPA